MGVIQTSLGLILCLAVLAIAIALDRRPYQPGKPNFVPLMIIALAAGLVLARHLFALVL
jgi:hypothetical protein